VDSDILEPEPVRQGGLMRPESVRKFPSSFIPFVSWSEMGYNIQRHTFRTPAKPLEPPTPRTSVLGLDRLAVEKRKAAAAESSRKKPRVGGHEDGESSGLFKGSA
jgi:pre-mRNA-splicing factor ATP-dependent RNA helicase DHX38/PRP16